MTHGFGLGAARIEPSTPVTAGELGQWTLTYVVGEYGIDDGGTIKVAHRFASDWEAPQFEHPSQGGYTTVATNGAAKLRVSFSKKGHERPWMKALLIDVYDGSLVPGDVVTVIFGDRSQNSPGMRAQTFQESAHEFGVFVDPTNACVARPIAQFPTLRVVPGAARELVCIVPTQAKVGEPAAISLQGRDLWGNPTGAPDGSTLQWDGSGEVHLEKGRLTFRRPGSGRIVARAGELSGYSNPITAHEEPPRFNRYWGDLHAQSDATVGTGTEEEYFSFARDAAHLDFASHQGNDFQMTGDDWQRLNEVVRRFHRDGEFVVFPGYEWSGNTSAGGDRNVFYREEGRPIIRSSHWQIPEVAEDALTPAHPADELFRRLREHIGIDNVLLGAHVGGRYADIRQYFDEELGPLVEVVSCWGVFEWMLWDAFDAGYIIGVMGNSDGHKGRPGAEGPGAGEFGIAGGLTCALAQSLTRRDIWNALRERRCYATTGARIDLNFEINDQPMGSILTTRAAQATATVRGTAPLASLTLYRGRAEYSRVRPDEFSRCDDSPRVRVSWSGSRMRSRGRRMQWDGSIRVSEARIRAAKTFQFDSALDGITAQTECTVEFQSQTTGDVDGIDLWLDHAHRGTLAFDGIAGCYEVALNELKGGESQIFDVGGLDLQVRVERYPHALTQRSLELRCDLPAQSGDKPVPWFVKAVQEDGHIAWSSPITIKPVL
jgi:hypothetical protein